MHTRQSVLYRILTHDAYHTGEISLTLGSAAWVRSISGEVSRAL